MLESIGRGAEIGPRFAEHVIAGPAQIAKRQPLARMPQRQSKFDAAVSRRAFNERIAK